MNILKNEPGIDIREFGRGEAPVWDAHHSRGEADLALKVHAAYDLDLRKERIATGNGSH